MHLHSADLLEGAPGIPPATPIRCGFYKRAIRAHGSALVPRSVKNDRRDIRLSRRDAIWSRRHDRTLPRLPLYSRPAASRREANNRNKRESTKPPQHALRSSTRDAACATPPSTRSDAAARTRESALAPHPGCHSLSRVGRGVCGIVGQILIPVPVVGALVGSLVGYTTAAALVQAGLLGMGPNNLVARERECRQEIERSCRIATDRMAECKMATESITGPASG